MRQAAMRQRFGSLGTVLFLLAAPAAAQKQGGDKGGDEEAKKGGGLMEDTARDPADTEAADEDAPFAPGKKTTFRPGGDEGEPVEGDDEPRLRRREEEEDEEPTPPVEPPGKAHGASLDVLLGFGEAPMVGPGDPKAAFTSYGFVLGGHFDLQPAFRIGLRVPWTTATVEQIGTQGSPEKSQSALGNPELFVRYRLSEPGQTVGALRFAVGVPIAQGNPDRTAVASDPGGVEVGSVQVAADAAAGHREPELYAASRLPVTPAATIAHRGGAFVVGGEAKVVVAFDLGDDVVEPTPSQQTGSYEKSSVLFVPIVGGGASYYVLRKVAVGLDVWASYAVARAVEWESSATPPTRFQLVVEPGVRAELGRVAPSLGFLIPAGGRLSDVKALRLGVDVRL